MRYELTPYQETAVGSLVTKIKQRQELFDSPYDPEYSAIVLSAPTGAGKTVIAAAMMEHLLDSSDILINNQDTTVLWVTDDPSLNEQTKLKMQLASDRSIRTEVLAPGFDQETLDKGKLYFVNIQAIGAKTRLANRSDGQTYSIWETFANTVKERGSNFIVVIDEAHHGVQKVAGKETITARIIDGDGKTDGQRVPIVIGISATGHKFKAAMSSTANRHGSARSLVEVNVPVKDVQESGLIKDRIVLYSPQDAAGVQADTTLLRDAVRRVKDFSRRWEDYCEEQKESQVLPVLVVQVGNIPTTATLNELTAVILDEWKSITIRNIVNVFGEHTDLELNSGEVKYLEPHLIQGQDDVRVVFAKDAITTGWDCPRAEVLVSFRSAKDATYIAQLIGRIVRQPLARRVVSDEALNQVYCLLPHFDGKEVDAVAKMFNESDETSTATVTKASISNTWNDDMYEEDELFELNVPDAVEQELVDVVKAAQQGVDYVKTENSQTQKTIPKPVTSHVTPRTEDTAETPVVKPVENRPATETSQQRPVTPPTTVPVDSEDESSVVPVEPELARDENTTVTPPVKSESVVLIDKPTDFNEDEWLPQPEQVKRVEKPKHRPKPKRFKVLESLPSYTIPNRKAKTSHIARLHKLASLLNLHHIHRGAMVAANNELHARLDFLAQQAGQSLTDRAENISHVVIGSKVYTTDGQEIELESGPVTRSTKLDKNNIEDVFRVVDKAYLRDGLATSYWRSKLTIDSDAYDAIQAKILVAALGSMEGVMDDIETRAEQLVDEWLKKHKLKISELSEAQQAGYKTLRGESRIPQEAKIVIPTSIESEATGDDDSESMMRDDKANRYKKHLFADAGSKDKTYYAALKPWEDKLIRELIAKDDTVAWYRNPSRGGDRSLCIPYQTVKGGKRTYAGMYPDFIVLRKDAATGEIKAVIVDPHGEHLSDSADKLRGLVEYAADHGAAYRAIYPIIMDKEGGKALTLTLHVAETRDKVIAALDEGVDVVTIYRTHGAEWVA